MGSPSPQPRPAHPSRDNVGPCRREPRAGRMLLRQRPRRHTRPPPPQPAAETERKDSRRHSSSLSGVPWKPGGEARTERTPPPPPLCRLPGGAESAWRPAGGEPVGPVSSHEAAGTGLGRPTTTCAHFIQIPVECRVPGLCFRRTTHSWGIGCRSVCSRKVLGRLRGACSKGRKEPRPVYTGLSERTHVCSHTFS